MKTLKLTSSIPPSVNHYLSYRAIIKNGRPMAMSYKTQEAKKYQAEFVDYIKKQVKAQGWDIPVTDSQHFYVDCVFYFPRLDMDCNNYFKCLLDAITYSQCIWVDDNVVCERVNAIYYDSSSPRIEMEIKPVDYIGIFKDTNQLDAFESNCIDCSRYKRNCSLLKNAKAGRIQEEIHDGVCKNFKFKKRTKGDL